MKKILALMLVCMALLFSACGNAAEEPIGFKNGNVHIDILASEHIITYAAAYDFDKGKEYFLELSVNLPNSDGTSLKKVLKGSFFKAQEDTKILTDSILIEDLKNELAANGGLNYEELQYTATIYNVRKGKALDGTSMSRKLFLDS